MKVGLMFQQQQKRINWMCSARVLNAAIAYQAAFRSVHNKIFYNNNAVK